MLIIRGNSTKSRISLDEDFDKIVLVNTLTHEEKVFEDLDPVVRGSLYHQVLLDFTGLILGEYKYTSYLDNQKVQSGILIIEPFDEEEAPVQEIFYNSEKEEVMTYQPTN